MTIGKRLKEVRGKLTQHQFAELLSVHSNTVARYERGERLPDSEYIERIYKRFSVSPQWLLTGIGEKNPLKKVKEIDPPIEKLIEEYKDAGVIPDYSVSEDEFAILKILRSLPDTEASEIIKILYDKYINYPISASDSYLKKSGQKIYRILNFKNSHFEKGIDVEQKIFEKKILEEEVSGLMYDHDIKLIDSYEKASNKSKFIEKLKKRNANVNEDPQNKLNHK